MCSRLGSSVETGKLYNALLANGKAKKMCEACRRPLDDHAMKVYEDYVRHS